MTTASMRGMVFDIQPFSIHDGPGIRTTVFLKGCPLSCAWCHNPESWQRGMRIAFDARSCTGCGACASACPRGAHSLSNGAHVFDRTRCASCGKCADLCPSKALERSGREMTVEEALQTVLVDKPFFLDTNGGLTVSGGEPLMQADFTAALLVAGRANGIHTVVETSGAGSTQDIERIARLTDLVLYDIKAAPCDYRSLIGIDFSVTATNLRLVKGAGGALWLRLPLASGVNDSENHFIAIAALTDEIKPDRVEIVPYHSLGMEKRRRFGLPDSPVQSLPSADGEQIARWISHLKEFGVEAHLPGED